MRVLLQWTLATPGDWEPLELADIRQWRQLPRRPEPVGGETIDNTKGWLFDVNVQGVTMGGADHYSVRPAPGGGLEVIRWFDDPEEFPAGQRYAQVWSFQRPAPDARHGGRVNTVQFLTVYAEDPAMRAKWEGQATSGGPVTVLPWSAFTPPPPNLTVHGIWVSDALLQQHVAARGVRGWEEWIE